MLFYLTLVAKEKTGYVKKMNEEDDYTCDPNDDDSAYDAWADNRVEEFYFRLEERISIMKELVKLYESHTQDDNGNYKPYIIMYNLEKELVQNLTGDKKHWKEDKTSNQDRKTNAKNGLPMPESNSRWCTKKFKMRLIMVEVKYQMKALIELWNDKSTHTNNVDERDNLERGLVRNLTGDYKNWQSINSIHDKWGSFSFGKYH